LYWMEGRIGGDDGFTDAARESKKHFLP
jgi:hypothetical protein